MSSKRKVMVLCPARNELANLRRVVPVWELIADRIIVADQGSTDGSREYLKQRPKVVVIENPDDGLDESRRAKLLVDAAREFDREAIHLYLDADEILSSDILTSPEWSEFCTRRAGTVGEFKWIQLWRAPDRYIAKDVMGPTPYQLAYIDDGRSVEGLRKIHENRGVGVRNPETIFHFAEVVCLHFAWLNYDRTVRRNLWYKAWWTVKGAKSYHQNNRNHGWHRNIDERNIERCPDRWLEAYKQRGMDVTSCESSALYWWDVDILRWFSEYGVKRFLPLDIWREVDWEEKRILAKQMGVTGIPDSPLQGPGKLRLAYHGLSVDGIGFVRRVAKRVWRGMWRLILP